MSPLILRHCRPLANELIWKLKRTVSVPIGCVLHVSFPPTPKVRRASRSATKPPECHDRVFQAAASRLPVFCHISERCPVSILERARTFHTGVPHAGWTTDLKPAGAHGRVPGPTTHDGGSPMPDKEPGPADQGQRSTAWQTALKMLQDVTPPFIPQGAATSLTARARRCPLAAPSPHSKGVGSCRPQRRRHLPRPPELTTNAVHRRSAASTSVVPR
jgi:hypothetical protein